MSGQTLQYEVTVGCILWGEAQAVVDFVDFNENSKGNTLSCSGAPTSSRAAMRRTLEVAVI